MPERRLSEVISIPISSKKIGEIDIVNVKNLLNDFDFNRDNDYYNFLYENLEIIISKRGSVLISMISTTNPLENLQSLSQLLHKINSIIAVKNPSIKIRYHNLSS